MLFLHKSICCDPSSEPSHRDGSDEGSQHRVSMRNKKNYPSIIVKYSSNLELCNNYVISCHFRTVLPGMISGSAFKINL